MKYMLDTDMCIYTIKHHPIQVKKKLSKLSIEDVGISSIVVAELEFGIAQSQKQADNRQALLQFLEYMNVEDWPMEATEVYGSIRAHLKQKGTPIGAMDLLIAAHAIQSNAILVTNNTREFKRVPKLKIDNWTK